MEILLGNEKHMDVCLSIAKELPQYFTEKAITTLSKDLRNHVLYIAMDLDTVVGFSTIHRKSNHVAEISWLVVKQERQRQGIGSALIDRIANDLRSQGIRLLEAKTLSEKVEYPPYEITRRFYKKMGFILLETIDPYPGWDPGTICAIYVKIL